MDYFLSECARRSVPIFLNPWHWKRRLNQNTRRDRLSCLPIQRREKSCLQAKHFPYIRIRIRKRNHVYTLPSPTSPLKFDHSQRSAFQSSLPLDVVALSSGLLLRGTNVDFLAAVQNSIRAVNAIGVANSVVGGVGGDGAEAQVGVDRSRAADRDIDGECLVGGSPEVEGHVLGVPGRLLAGGGGGDEASEEGSGSGDELHFDENWNAFLELVGLEL